MTAVMSYLGCKQLHILLSSVIIIKLNLCKLKALRLLEKYHKHHLVMSSTLMYFFCLF